MSRQAALVTGASRGIGAATAVSLASSGFDVVITYRNKRSRADEVATQVRKQGVRALVVGVDITRPNEIADLFRRVGEWTRELGLLVLNASGGLQRSAVNSDLDYPKRINRDAQVLLVEEALPLLKTGSTIVFVTSHWAHLWGDVEQLPAYVPIAESKYEGEQELLKREPDFAALGIRLLVVTADLVQGTITPKLLARTADGSGMRTREDMTYPTTSDVAEAITGAVLDPSLESPRTVVVGRPLSSIR